MARTRLFQTAGVRFSEIPLEHIANIKWNDTVSGQAAATVRLTPAAALTLANAPDSLIIVPSERESLQVPAYGPYEVASGPDWNGEGYTIQGTIGVDFTARFATGSGPGLASIVSQVRAFSNDRYEPFLGWTSAPLPTDGPNVAKLGFDAVTNLVTATLYNVADLADLENRLGQFGLSAYMLVEWPASGNQATITLAIWPLHPLAITLFPGLSIERNEYFVQPRIGAVSTWRNNLPMDFVSPNVALPNETAITEVGNMEHHPNVAIPDAFNSPVGARKPSYRTRRINVGYRLLGVEEVIQVYHTGSRDPALWRSPQVVSAGGTTKMAEELQRWNMQNSAAELSLKRFVGDSWAALSDEFYVPHQVVTFPQEIFAEGWNAEQRAFVIREVNHEYDVNRGYSQEIKATLWQGPFERLEAMTD